MEIKKPFRRKALKKNGVRNGQENKLLVSPFELTEIIDFNYIPKFMDKEFLHDRYIKKKLTSDEIAAEICSSRSTVLKYLKEFGIPTRERSYVKRSKNTAYGQEIKNFKTVEIESENRRIEDMKKLLDKGYSYRKIAEILNDLNVPTKQGKSLWDAKVIHQILNRNKT